MNKEQSEYLELILDSLLKFCEELTNKESENIHPCYNAELEMKVSDMGIYIEKLVESLRESEKTLTLEEIKQEWEKLGYVCEEGACHLVLRYKGTNNMIHIWEDHTYRVDDWLTFQEHNLLTRTFRALGWFDE